jgi:asparagine synthase (glutamine-hydrolysing)
MGALAAVLTRSDPPDPGVARRMLAAAAHRGHVHDTLVRGRCVLAVATREDAGDAGLAASDRFALAFTGALDNREALAKELGLEADAHPPEVVLAAFQRWSDETPSHLRGAFAGIVTDGRALWCFRDHLGFRTLFFREEREAFIAATEAKQVVEGAGLARQPDLEVLESIFYGDYGDDTPSALRGVSRLGKSRILHVGEGTSRIRRYWDPRHLLETARMSPGEVQEAFDELMTQAVSRMMTGSDVVSLSGGIDSPAIAAYGAPEHQRRFGRPLAALSAVFPHLPSVDESEYVHMMADRYGLELHTYEKVAKPLDRLGEWMRLLDGPIPTVLITDAEEHYRTARDLGFRTMLTGEIAELTFDMRRRLLKHLLTRGRLGAARQHLAGQRSKGVGRAALVRQVGAALVPVRLEVAVRRLRRPKPNERLPGWIDLRRATSRAPENRSQGWRAWQLSWFDGPGLSMEADEIVQSTIGVSSRRPFADVDLWEFFMSLPAEVKFPTVVTKGLMRQLLRGRVPDPILDRREKTVFNESVRERIDYAELRRLLSSPSHPIAGVDYRALLSRIDEGDLGVFEYTWAKDLAATHAFMDA